MRKRPFDKRVGYFANGYDVFEEDSQKAETEIFAVRWRLEPKNEEDALKQKNGEKHVKLYDKLFLEKINNI